MAIKKETKNTNVGKLGRWIGEDLKLYEGKVKGEDDTMFIVISLDGKTTRVVNKNAFKFDNNMDDES